METMNCEVQMHILHKYPSFQSFFDKSWRGGEEDEEEVEEMPSLRGIFYVRLCSSAGDSIPPVHLSS